MEKYIVRVNGKEYEVELEKVETPVSHTEHFRKAEAASRTVVRETATKENQAPTSGSVKEGVNYLEAGAAGKVFKIVKKAGESVAKGETMIILEAMKMEIPMVSLWDGTVNQVLVSEGQQVEAGEKLAAVL